MDARRQPVRRDRCGDRSGEQLVDDPARRVLRVVAAAGSRFQDWIDQVETLLEDYAVLIGANVIEAEVRDASVAQLTHGRSHDQ